MSWFITLLKYVQKFKAIYLLGIKKNSKNYFKEISIMIKMSFGGLFLMVTYAEQQN